MEVLRVCFLLGSDERWLQKRDDQKEESPIVVTLIERTGNNEAFDIRDTDLI